MGGDVIHGKTEEIKKNITLIVSKKLSDLANKGATPGELQQATQKLAEQAAGTVSQDAASATVNITQDINLKESQEQGHLQGMNKQEKEALLVKEKEISHKANHLSPQQEASVAREREYEYVKRKLECEDLPADD